MDKVSPKCLYCNGEMVPDPQSAFKDMRQLEYWYWCEGCGSQSPRMSETDYATGDEAGRYWCSFDNWEGPWATRKHGARVAARQRAQRENRVLTFDEFIASDADAVIWFEWKTGNIQRIFRDDISTEDEPVARGNYGVIARCWLRRPTDEERAAVKWL